MPQPVNPKTGASVKSEGKSASSASAPDDFVHDLTWDAASVADAKSSVAGSVISSLFGGHQVGEDILKAFNFAGSWKGAVLGVFDLILNKRGATSADM